MKTPLLILLTAAALISNFNSANAQKKDDDEAYSKPIPTPAETNHIMITYRLDGARAIYIYFGNNKADLVITPKLDMDKLNDKKMGIGPTGVVVSYVVDLLNQYDKEGFELISSNTYVPGVDPTPNTTTPSWTQCILKKRTQ